MTGRAGEHCAEHTKCAHQAMQSRDQLALPPQSSFCGWGVIYHEIRVGNELLIQEESFSLL